MRELPLTPTAIQAGLRTIALPQSIHCYDVIPSTMEPARSLLQSTPAAGLPLLVTAEEQTAGRGRLGRRWVAPHGSALLCSLAMRPQWLAADRTVALVWMMAVSLCEAVQSVADIAAGLKWPNDLLLPGPAGHAKAAGMLIEVTHAGSGPLSAVLGCGVNVHAAPPPGSTPYPAISLSAAAGRPIDRLTLLQAWLTRLDAWYRQAQLGRIDDLYQAWRSHLIGIGGPVRIHTAAGELHGTFVDVDAAGSLLLQHADGTLNAISTGDVGMI